MQVLASKTAVELGYLNKQSQVTLGQTVSCDTRLVSVCNVQKVVNGDAFGASSDLALQQLNIANPIAFWLRL
jgi:hypothetical protein